MQPGPVRESGPYETTSSASVTDDRRLCSGSLTDQCGRLG